MDVVGFGMKSLFANCEQFEFSRTIYRTSKWKNYNVSWGQSIFRLILLCKNDLQFWISTQGFVSISCRTRTGEFWQVLERLLQRWKGKALWIPSLEQWLNTEFLHIWWLLVTSIYKIRIKCESIMFNQDLLWIEEAESS